MDLHETLDAILTHPTAELTPPEIAYILGVSRQSITEAIRLEHLEGVKYTFRCQGNCRQYRVTKSALVRWLWDHTTGDKSMLRAALQQKAPGLLAVFEQPENLVRFPAGKTQTSKTPTHPPQRYVHATHSNSSRRYANHPDLFDEFFAAGAEAGGAGVSGEGGAGGAADQSRCG